MRNLMKQTDVQSIYHMQMPRWLFSDPRYADMSLDAKVAYTFLLNRFQLSRRNYQLSATIMRNLFSLPKTGKAIWRL